MTDHIWTTSTATRQSRVFGLLLMAIFLLMAVLPFFAGRIWIQNLFQILTLLVLAQCWNLLAGYAGMISIGQQAFVGLGGYTLFVLVIFWQVPPLIGIVAGGFVGICFAIPVAIFAMRLQGAYFAIGSWVMAEIARNLLARQEGLGGGSGLSLGKGVGAELPGVEWLKELGFRPAAAVDVVTYWMALILCVVTITAIYRFMRTPRGLGLAALRDNLTAARSVGVEADRLKLLVHLGVAFVTAIAGALIFLQQQRLTPETGFSVIQWSAFVIFVVVIGGIGTIEGPIFGVIVFFLFQSTLSHLGPIYLIFLGMFGIVSMLVMPAGIWGYLASRFDLALFPTHHQLKRR